MVHNIWTGFGDSTITYWGQDIPEAYEHHLLGLNQGNGAGPTIWSIVSSTIFKILRDQGYGTKFISSLTKAILHLVEFSYVDDCNLFSSSDTLDVTFDHMQASLQDWERLIEVTGGCLVLDKSPWYLVDFVWNKGNWRFKDPADARFHLEAKMHNGDMAPLKRLQASEAMEMLGIYISPSGNQSKQVEAMRQITDTWADRFQFGYLRRGEVCTALKTTIAERIEYPLQALALSPKECRYILAPVTKVGLPKAGIPTSIPTTMRHAPVEDFSFGILGPYTLQCCSWIQSIVDHIWTSSPTGALLTVAAEDAQLEMGLTSDLSMQPSWDPLHWLTTPSWIHSCLQFMWTNQIRIKPFGTALTSARYGDKGIMEAFAPFIDDVSSLRWLNRCCMHKKVIWLSDLFTPDGKTVQDESFTSKECVYSLFQWPLQHYTASADWSLWKKCHMMVQDWRMDLRRRRILSKKHSPFDIFRWHIVPASSNLLLDMPLPYPYGTNN